MTSPTRGGTRMLSRPASAVITGRRPPAAAATIATSPKPDHHEHGRLQRRQALASGERESLRVSQDPGRLPPLGWGQLASSETSPRWVLSITDAAGARSTVVLGCALATLANGNFEGWWMDFWGDDAIRARVVAQAGEGALNGTLSSLSIVFDEGPASVLLDNIIVTTSTAEGRWYGPGA